MKNPESLMDYGWLHVKKGSKFRCTKCSLGIIIPSCAIVNISDLVIGKWCLSCECGNVLPLHVVLDAGAELVSGEEAKKLLDESEGYVDPDSLTLDQLE